MLARIFSQVNRFRVDDCELPHNVRWLGRFSKLATFCSSFSFCGFRSFGLFGVSHARGQMRPQLDSAEPAAANRTGGLERFAAAPGRSRRRGGSAARRGCNVVRTSVGPDRQRHDRQCWMTRHQEPRSADHLQSDLAYRDLMGEDWNGFGIFAAATTPTARDKAPAFYPPEI